MSSDYDAITKSNIENLGKDTKSRKSQVNLYSKPTHFIYELLQNADDYEATEVEFWLSKNELILEHNGIPFKEENVRAISYFESGTSAEDSLKTGQFGLGFKSVFAYTASPRIFSGEENFELFELYRLRKLEHPKNLDSKKTRIVLPFNHHEKHPDFVEQEKSPKDAYEEISKKLRDIGITSLMFTKHIKEIKWSDCETDGHYLKEQRDEFRTYLTDEEVDETYWTYSRKVQWKGEQLNPLSISFRLEENCIVPENKRSLFVLFETGLETHLGFIVNGPFKTTPSRGEIKYEDPLNRYLIEQLSELLGSSGFFMVRGSGDHTKIRC